MKQSNRHEATTGNWLEQLESRQVLAANGPDFFQGKGQIAAVVAGDFDGDGDLDLAAWRTRHESAEHRSVLFVLTNDGDGNFNVAAKKRMQFQAGEMAAGDFDGDGTAELATGAGVLPYGATVVRVFSFDSENGRLDMVARRRCEQRIDGLAAVGVAGDADGLLIMETPYPFSFRITAGTFAIDGDRLVLEQSILTEADGIDGVRVVDADGDGNDDVLVAQRTATPREVALVVYSQSASDGTFGAPQQLLSYLSNARCVPLLADVDGDGHADVVYVSTDDDAIEVNLRRSDGAGAYLNAEAIFQGPRAFGSTAEFELLGFGPGVDGLDEIRLVTTARTDGRLPTSGSSLTRFVHQTDGSFERRLAQTQSSEISFFPLRVGYIAANFTNDSATDYLWIHRNPRRLTLMRFGSDGGQPLISGVDARQDVSFPNPVSRTVTTGDTVILSVYAEDPEQRMGEPGGGISAVSFYLDTNGNGIIDSGDVLASGVGEGNPVIAAHWPRGTFHVLALVTDVTGLSTVGCSELPLTIV